jgi:REP element-mobilizing transposase RayT
MAHDYILLVTWKTWAAAPSIDAALAAQLARALPSLAIAEGAAVLELAILANHVHAVVEITSQTDVPRLVQRMKGASARFANRDGWTRTHLRWERGYDSRTVARGDLDRLRVYLDGQARHHGRPLLARWSGAGRAAQAVNVLRTGKPLPADARGASAPL